MSESYKSTFRSKYKKIENPITFQLVEIYYSCKYHFYVRFLALHIIFSKTFFKLLHLLNNLKKIIF